MIGRTVLRARAARPQRRKKGGGVAAVMLAALAC